MIGVRLQELLAAADGLDARVVEPHPGAGGVDIGAVVHETADVVDGALYCCVPGSRVNGHDLAPSAVAAGAAAVLVDHPLQLPVPVPQLVVSDVRAAMGPLASAFWGHPSQQLTVAGVTGTAGKTTVTHLLCAALSASGRSCSVIGTLSGAHTTPEATELQAMLAGARHAGNAAVAVEVSSHGLEMHRVDGTRFDVAVFTNLSRDHLDFHHAMDAYFDAKARLFSPAFTQRAVVSIDDRWGRTLAERAAVAGLEVHNYSVDDAHDLAVASDGARFVWRDIPIHLALTGRFNVANAVAAATAADAIGIAPEAIARGLNCAGAVPGRFELVDEGQPFSVLVDYSHKPDALEQALLAARDLVRRGEGGSAACGRLTVVFGCGGDKDAGKRPLMGAVAGRLADRVVVTSDNPRSEDPLDIINQIVRGMPPDAAFRVEPDRQRAIVLAMREARPGDVVLIAGKGHESTQIIGDRAVPFDDRSETRTALAEAGWR